VKIYETDKIRNVAFVGPTGSGKTTLIEALLFDAGAITRVGKVEEGNTVADYSDEEIKRKSSIHAKLIALESGDLKINILDTPGYIDFVGEVISALRVADCALFSFCAVSGPAVGTEEFFRYASENNLPCMIVINRMDKDRASFAQTLEKLRASLGKSVVPLFVPIGEEGAFKGVIDIAKMKAYEFENGKPKDVPLPEIDTSSFKEMLVEALADVDDTLLSDYLEGKQLTAEEVISALKTGISQRKVFPVICSSAVKNAGVSLVLEMIKEYMPAPSIKIAAATAAKETAKLTGTKTEPLSAYIFKTTTEAHVGELSYVRVYSGAINHSTAIYNSTRQAAERAGQLIIAQGKKRFEVMVLNAGDIGILPKLKNSHTGDTLCAEAHQFIYPASKYPEPVYSLAVHPRSKEDQEKIGIAFNAFSREDLTFKMRHDPETRETIISGMGDVHLEMILERFRKQFGVEVDMTAPRIPYKETIRKKASAQGKYKKQTGGRGQYGDTWIELEPLPRSKGFEFVDRVVGGVIPKNYIPAVEKGIVGAMEEGVVAGYHVVDLKATLYDGSYHEVDSSDMSFKIAGSMGFKKAFEEAAPVILEPIMDLTVSAPEEYIGGIAGDLNKRRGRILTIEEKKIVAQVPLSEIAKYAIDIRSITHGRGHFVTKFARYEEAPVKTQEELVTTYKKKREEGAK
jgi:elongation factor G